MHGAARLKPWISRRRRRRRVPLLLALVACGLLTACGQLDGLNPVTRQGSAITGLFWLVMALSLVVFLVVITPMLIVLVRFRARGPNDEEPTQVAGNTRLEMTWTGGAFLLVVLLAVAAVTTMGTVVASPSDAQQVRVIGHQWWWEYQYPGQQISTADELHVPTGQPLMLQVTGADVIHSFWVPQFGWKEDGIPGKYNPLPIDVTQPGTYDGTCTEFCGLQHAWMRIRVVAQSPADFQAWVQAQQQPATAPSDAAGQQGQQLFMQNTCVSCHAIEGTGAQGKVGPDLTHFGSRTVIGSGVLDNTPQNVQRWILNAQSIKPGVLMPAFRNLSNQDAEAIAAYLEELK